MGDFFPSRYATKSVQNLSWRCFVGVVAAAARALSRPVLLQSLGLTTTLKLGAMGESAIRHSSISTAKKFRLPVVFWFRKSSAATCSGLKDSATQMTFLAPTPAA